MEVRRANANVGRAIRGQRGLREGCKIRANLFPPLSAKPCGLEKVARQDSASKKRERSSAWMLTVVMPLHWQQRTSMSR